MTETLARDPYQELGVHRTASADEIRKAFRKLAKENHPDTNPHNKESEERFKRVTAAFDIVGDVEKRKKFDAGAIDADGRERAQGFPGGGGPWGGQGGQRGGFEGGFEGVDLNDILGDMFGGRGRGGPGGGFAQKGGDVRARLEIDLEEAIKGGRKRISFTDGRTIDVTIPKGAQEGQTLRLKGQGQPGRGGAGDALIEIAIATHPLWKREGDNLVMDVPVTVYDAVLGGKVEARTPDGNVTLTVPKGASAGTRLRLKGRGAPDGKGHRGDLYARLMIALPETIDSELEAFAEGWKAERAYQPRRKG